MFAKELLFLFSLLLLASLSTSDDSSALLAFKSSVDRRDSLSNWVNSTSPCSGSWFGVTCSARTHRVIRLVLENLNLTGTVPPSLSPLTELRVLSLKQNEFSSLSVNFSSWLNLKHAFLSHNRFSGGFPTGISTLRRLRRLDLSYNNFSGEIPVKELAELPHLLTLRVQVNSFTGTLGFNAINSFRSISEVNFAENELSGEIPAFFWRFPASKFAGNKELCGKPLPYSCSNRTVTVETVQSQEMDDNSPKTKHLSNRAKAAIVAVDVLAVLLALLTITWCCYRKSHYGGICISSGLKNDLKKERNVSKSFSISSVSNKDSFVDDVNEGELVVFDGYKGFEKVDDLLKSSAELLGRGSMGTTYKVVMDGDGGGGAVVVVVKRVREVLLRKKRKEVDGLLREIGCLRHPNVVSLRGFYHSRDELLLVYDYLQKGSLHSLLHENRGPGRTPVDWATRIKVASDSASGLAFVHQCDKGKLVHGHLTTSNIIVDQFGNARISDVGLHLLLASSHSPDDAIKAPELTPNSTGSASRKFTYKSDVYGFGVVLLEILTGKTATGEGETSLVKWVQHVAQENWTKEVFDFELMSYKENEGDMIALLQVALLCLAPLPRDRPKMTVVHRMIEDIRMKGGKERLASYPLEDLSSDSSPTPSESTPST